MAQTRTTEVRRFNALLIGINILIVLEHHFGRRLYPVNTAGKEFIWLVLPAILSLSLLLSLFSSKFIVASGSCRILLREPFTLRIHAKKYYSALSVVNLLISGLTAFSIWDAQKYVLLVIPVIKALFVLMAVYYFPKDHDHRYFE